MSDFDHTNAIHGLTAERYVLGELDASERDTFEEHFFSCAECAQNVRLLTQFRDGMGHAGEHAASRRHAPLAAAKSRWWRRRLPRLPAVPVAAALALLVGLGGYQSLVTVPQLREQVRAGQQLQAGSWHFLAVARSNPVQIQVTKSQQAIGLTLSRSGSDNWARYRIDVEDEQGRKLKSSVLAAPASGEELQLLLPVSGLQSGLYVVRVSGVGSTPAQDGSAEVGRYPFTLIHKGM